MASLVEGHGHAGDEGNFEALYRTYKSEVHRLASYLLRNTADAEDASQTVFLNVLRALRQGVKPAEPRAWLLAITRNVCFSRRRAAAARPGEVELDPETAGHPGENGGPSADDIVGALARMLPNQRTALILRDFRGVPRPEISELLHLSPTGVEALLTRARSSFREELEAGGQPFECAETKALVEQQLEGVITVAERHSLRAHLRHCSPCSTLARAARSSRGKLASLLPWTSDWISRLAAAFSQAPTAVHVVGAISSTAIVASVAIPVALVQGPGAVRVTAQPAPAAVAATHHASSVEQRAAKTLPTSRAATRASLALKAAARAHGHAAGAAGARAAHHVARTAPAGTTPATASPAPSSPATAAPVAVGSEPRTASPIVTQPYAGAPAGTAPRSISPAARPPAKAKPKPARRTSKRHGIGRHPTDPPDRTSGSTPPAATLPPPAGGAVGGSGPGFAAGSSSAPAAASSAQTTSADTGSGSSTDGSSSTSNNNGSSGKSHHHKHNK